ncbi:MAG: hypothetical protein D6830_02975 [Ignavibacteria bacterium]|nr:MAG: hypothetical protein D6830_02975 [Ignavibacteria bacterium]
MRKVSIFIIILISFTVSSCTKNAGKIYSKKEANELYGNVTYQTQFPAVKIKEWLNKTENKIMFGFSENKLIVCGDNREVLLLTGVDRIRSSDTLRVFDKSIVEKFLQREKSDTLALEFRGKVFTISGNKYTLEYSFPCPPFCE